MKVKTKMAEKSKKLNGSTKWIIIILAILNIATVGYNSVATHVIAKNDIQHLQKDVTEMKALLIEHITQHK